MSQYTVTYQASSDGLAAQWAVRRVDLDTGATDDIGVYTSHRAALDIADSLTRAKQWEITPDGWFTSPSETPHLDALSKKYFDPSILAEGP